VLALMVFWTNLGREVLMDIVDLEADRSEGFRTLPLIYGLASMVVLPCVTGHCDPRRLVVSAKVVMFAYLVLVALQVR